MPLFDWHCHRDVLKTTQTQDAFWRRALVMICYFDPKGKYIYSMVVIIAVSANE